LRIANRARCIWSNIGKILEISKKNFFILFGRYKYTITLMIVTRNKIPSETVFYNPMPSKGNEFFII